MLRRLSERLAAAGAMALRGALPGAGPERAAVLMYHNVCRLPVEEAGLYQHVLPHQFADQMCLLRLRGWRVVALERLVELAWAGSPLPPRTAAITFDDGYRGILAAWGHLERHGFAATIFLATGDIGQPCFRWLRVAGAPEDAAAPLSWPQVRELARRGAGLGSHSVSHLPLDTLKEEELRRELVASRQEMEERLGRRVSLFSVPFAWPEEEAFRERLAAALREAGYVGAVTTAIGRVRRGADILALPRLPVSAADSLADFEAKLEGAYDWLRPVQRAYKLWLKPRLKPDLQLARQTPQ